MRALKPGRCIRHKKVIHFYERPDIPKINPDYDPEVYHKANRNTDRVMWGPFKGERPLEAEEK